MGTDRTGHLTQAFTTEPAEPGFGLWLGPGDHSKATLFKAKKQRKADLCEFQYSQKYAQKPRLRFRGQGRGDWVGEDHRVENCRKNSRTHE